jgi:hypothetical protein
MSQGKGETEEAEALREESLHPWTKLNEQEMDRVNGLSADLYMLENNEIYERVKPEERSRERLGPRLQAAWDRQDWDEVLAWLRTGPDFLNQDLIAYLRGRCWQEMGHHDVALLFFEYAAKRDPQNVNYQMMVIEELVQLGHLQDILQRANAFREKEDSYLRLVG